MNSHKRFNILLPKYLTQYKRVNGQDCPYKIDYSDGWVWMQSADKSQLEDNYRIGKFEEMKNNLSKRPDYQSPEPIKTFDEKLEEIARHIIQKMKGVNNKTVSLDERCWVDAEIKWVDYLREILKD